MMKNEKGITLSTLMITIVIMIILTGVGVGAVYTGINDFKDNRLEIELGLVRQVVVEQYQKAKAVNKLESKDPVEFWVGTKIVNTSELGFEPALTTQNFEEDYYYQLDKDALDKLGIQDSKHTYIVNYKTGEVYNETQKVNSQNQPLYLPAINYNVEETEDTESFNDWE